MRKLCYRSLKKLFNKDGEDKNVLNSSCSAAPTQYGQ